MVNYDLGVLGVDGVGAVTVSGMTRELLVGALSIDASGVVTIVDMESGPPLSIPGPSTTASLASTLYGYDL